MADLENTDPNTVRSNLAEKHNTERLPSVTAATVIDEPIITVSTIGGTDGVVVIQDTVIEVSDGDHDCRAITLEGAGVSQAPPKTDSQGPASTTVPILESSEIRTPVKNTKSKLTHFKRNRIQLPPKTNTSFESHPAYITLLAEYYKTLELTSSLLACIVQDQSGERPSLSKLIVKKLSSTTKLTEDQTNFVNSFLDCCCQRVNYGLVDNMNTNYHVFRWEVKLELIPDELRAEVEKKRLEKAKVKQDIINYYNGLDTAEKIELKLNDINSFANSDAVATEIVPLPEVQTQEPMDLDAQQCKENNTPAKANKKERKRKSTDTPKIPKENPTPKSQKKLKMEKNQPTLWNFFKPISRPLEAPTMVANTKLNFAPFNLKSGVELASENLFFHIVNGDAWLSSMDSCSKDNVDQDFKLFIKNSTSKPRKTNRTPKVSSEINWKLLQFAEDYRPPYYGTTQPLFKLNRVANPFLKSAKLDYENDSELEWEEDEAGEELVSENEESEEEQDEDEKDVNFAKKGWLVPHGYLSDDEGSEQGEKNVPTSPRKKKLEVLVPILIDIKSKNATDYEKLNPLKVVYLFELSTATKDNQTSTKKLKKTLSEQQITDLKQFIADNNGLTIDNLVTNSTQMLKTNNPDSQDITKVMVKNALKQYAVKKSIDGKKACWHLV